MQVAVGLPSGRRNQVNAPRPLTVSAAASTRVFGRIVFLVGHGDRALAIFSRMAKKTVVEFIDDLDGKPIEIDDLNTIEWSWRGVDYVLDTSTPNLEKIEEGKVPFTTVLSKSTRVSGRRRSASGARRATGASGDAGERAAIRTWARDLGYDVGDRGRISSEIVAAYYGQSGAR